jgi:hypothetical protein
MGSIDEVEGSFFNLAGFVPYGSIMHNLHLWHINIDSIIKRGGQCEMILNVPYGEMEIETEELLNDINFFNKSTLRLKIRINKENINYLFSNKVKILFYCELKYIFIDTPYIYPHNWYYMYNRSYLCNKVIYSINYIKSFIEAYKNVFNNNVPFIFIAMTNENAKEYIFDIIIKEYLNIYYTSTENDIIIMNLVVDKSYYNNNVIKYKKIRIIIPRVNKDKNMTFKFITGSI